MAGPKGKSTMDLYLIRHADAEPVGGTIEKDEDRPLTEAGRAQVAALAAALQRAGVHLDKIITSPVLRARQTAEGLLKHWPGPAPELSAADALAPKLNRKKKIKQFLLSLEGHAIGLVGHQPYLGELAGWLIGGKKAHLAIAKAGFARIQTEEAPGKGTGVLTWLVTPEWFGEE